MGRTNTRIGAHRPICVLVAAIRGRLASPRNFDVALTQGPVAAFWFGIYNRSLPVIADLRQAEPA